MVSTRRRAALTDAEKLKIKTWIEEGGRYAKHWSFIPPTKVSPPSGTAGLDPRNESGWSPDLTSTGAVHLTATFAEPLRAAATPFLTVQLNFGNGNSLVPGLFEVLVLTGTDDGTDLPAAVVAALQTPRADRSPEMNAALWQNCAAHGAEFARHRTELANLEERLSPC